MSKLPKGMTRTLSGDDPVLKVNLKTLFGSNVPDSSLFRQSVGQAIIDRIRKRTENNTSRTGSRFPNYSKTYAETMEFIAAGKSKSDPNLALSGDMLGLLDIVEEGDDFIEIGWTDSTQSAKAHGHITGNVGKKRDFLGLPSRDLEDIVEEFSEVIEDVPVDEVLSTLEAFRRVSGVDEPSGEKFVKLSNLLTTLRSDLEDGEV